MMRKLVILCSFFLTIFINHALSQSNSALRFDGVTSYVDLDPSVQPEMGMPEYSAEAWIMVADGAPTNQKVLYILDGGQQGFALSITQDVGSGNYYFTGSIALSGSYYEAGDASNTVPKNVWTHIALTWRQNGYLRTYINGIKKGEVSTGANSYMTSFGAVTMGCGDGSWGFFKGDISEVRVWKTERTQAEIAANMNASISPATEGLKAYYTMTDGDPNTLYDHQINEGVKNGSIYNALTVPATITMPVELTSFTAAVSGNTVRLSWRTAAEVDNAGFEVERKSTVWEKAAFIDGHGTTNAPQSYAFSEKQAPGKYQYRLKQIDRDGHYVYSNVVEADVKPLPTTFSLAQNYPNPFNPATNIPFSVASTGRARLTVMNILGETVCELFNGVAEAGIVHTAVFDASRLSSGLYFYRLESAGQVAIKKMQLIR